MPRKHGLERPERTPLAVLEHLFNLFQQLRLNGLGQSFIRHFGQSRKVYNLHWYLLELRGNFLLGLKRG